MRKTVCTLMSLLLFLVVMAGCGDPISESRILRLYHQLKVGMTRDQVEAILGKPLFPSLDNSSGEEMLWYIDERERRMLLTESPMGPGGIRITYKDRKLIDKWYNPQWIKAKYIRAYEQKHKAEPADSTDKK